MGQTHVRVRSLVIAAIAAVALWPAAASAVTISHPISAVSFATTQTGYLAGGSVSGNEGFVSSTRDGGLTWQSRIVNRFMYAVSASIGSQSAMAVGDALNGVYATADSGSTWTSESPLLARGILVLRGAAYLSGNRRVAVGKLDADNGRGLITSSVGAVPWTVDFEGPIYPPTVSDPDGVPSNAGMAGIDAAPGGAVAWAVGNDRSKVSNDSLTSDPLIYKTTDSGSSWTTQTVADDYDVSSVAAVDAQHAFIGTASDKHVLRTTDGTNWTSLSSPNAIVVNAVDAIDANHLVVAGNAGRIAWTSNASATPPTWSTFTTATASTLLGVQMIDATHWIVVGDKETILRTADGGATWTGSTGPLSPTVNITSPVRETMLNSATIAIQGAAGDGAGVGVAKVEVRLQRGSGQSWNGSDWTASDIWLPATSTDGWSTWAKSITLPEIPAAGTSMTVSARATDGFGLVSTVRTVSSLPASVITRDKTSITIGYGASATIAGSLKSDGLALAGKAVRLTAGSSSATSTTGADGRFSFTVKPTSRRVYTLTFAGDATHMATSVQVTVIPKAYVGTPVVPSYVRHTRYFKTYSSLKPKHTTGTKVLTFTFQRYEKKSGRYQWVTKKVVTAKAAAYRSYSRCTVSVKLPAGRKWRVQAKHADTGHATSYSSRRYFRIH